MEHFCTIFDSAFLPQGMALHASLQRHARPFVLWVLCMDPELEASLKRLALQDVWIIPLRDVETSALLAVKSGRSRAEYCWTLTAYLPKVVMDYDLNAKRVTYVDADCWFVSDPRRILREMDEAKKDVLITPHDYLPEHDQAVASGKFCVQFVPFRRTAAGLEVLKWWQDRCLEWCFSRVEKDRFGDQKYLDQWPVLFPDAVHVLKNTTLTLAPWNAARYKKAHDIGHLACMYHFHGLRVFQGWIICLCIGWDYHLPGNILKVFYGPYLKDIAYNRRVAVNLGIRERFPSTEQEWNIFVRLKDLICRLIKNKGRIWRRIW